MKLYSGINHLNRVMKNIKNILLLVLAAFISMIAGAQDFSMKKTIETAPSPAKLVNDFTGTLTDLQRQTLEDKLVKFDDSTSTQITVVIVPSLDGMDVSDAATELGRSWGVGQKKNNNGVVLLISKDDHKLNISPGYGLEGALPDVTCKEIIDTRIVPNFKGQDFYRGIDEGTDAIMAASKGEYTAPAGYHKKGASGYRIVIIIFIIILFLVLSSGSGGGGSFMSRRGFAAWTIGNMIGGGSGGGWSGGGGGSSGGFGGFGGGSFGGGGSSGSW